MFDVNEHERQKNAEANNEIESLKATIQENEKLITQQRTRIEVADQQFQAIDESL
jgi:hypothetical protein